MVVLMPRAVYVLARRGVATRRRARAKGDGNVTPWEDGGGSAACPQNERGDPAEGCEKKTSARRRPGGGAFAAGKKPTQTPQSAGLSPGSKLSERGDADVAKRSTRARGYGVEHQALRRKWARLVRLGGVACARCGEPIEP